MSGEDVQIWFRATETLDDAAIAADAAVLSADELAHCRRFHFPRDARDYAAAHALLRHTLSRAHGRAPAEWTFGRTTAGKPFLLGQGDDTPAFSLSHTRGMVACALTARAPVGVDVECVDREVDAAGLAARFFSPPEAALLMRLGAEARRDRFFDLWTLKEALIKALGTGLATSLNRLAFSIASDRAISLDAPVEVEPTAWQFGLFAPGPRHRMAVAVRRTGVEPARLTFLSAAHDA